ncbi:hypothetical protein CVIRNUC_011199 [Coccomyxa viridis]|uniref:catalase n=1 Tax=Coccomyxa viridis TaxID=1274662 RepID=A0AAV1INX1_9CHLO|nr:hypothetical protein CVIRNUC_011199 [Coccomyxa viridis]
MTMLAVFAVVRSAVRLAAAQSDNPLDNVLDNDASYFTTNFGLPVSSDNASLTVGARGPVLLEDLQVQEKLASTNRERIPERIVHAKGAVAKGYFEVTDDITDLTFADVFSSIGKKTDVIVRFSIVTASVGSPEWIRDPRGFAVKFYTGSPQGGPKQGCIWDLVGNNFPVFFVRDGAQFPDLVHSAKPSPVNRLSPGWRLADFLSWHPESMNIMTYLMDDVGIPADYRHMNGSGVHTFALISSSGNSTFVKFHWVPTAGEKNLLDADIPAVAGMQPDGSFASKDLYTAISNGDFPEWYMYIQTMDPARQLDYSFDPLDPTKTWPEDVFPMRRVGRLILNQNIGNFFNENEQLAFSPGHIIPGISFTDDKLLQWRLVAYDDAQRYRIGPNFRFVDVNRPRCPLHNNAQDGPLNVANQTGEINYFPSEFSNQVPVAQYPYDNTTVGPAPRVRTILNKTDDFEQAGVRYRSFDAARQGRFVTRIAGLLADPMNTAGITSRWMSYLRQVDAGLANQVSNAIPAAKQAMGPTVSAKSNAGG